MDNTTQTEDMNEELRRSAIGLNFLLVLCSMHDKVDRIDTLIYKTMSKCEADDDWVCALCGNEEGRNLLFVNREDSWVVVKGICGHIFHIACVRKQIAKDASDTKCHVCGKEIICSCNVQNL